MGRRCCEEEVLCEPVDLCLPCFSPACGTADDIFDDVVIIVFAAYNMDDEEKNVRQMDAEGPADPQPPSYNETFDVRIGVEIASPASNDGLSVHNRPFSEIDYTESIGTTGPFRDSFACENFQPVGHCITPQFYELSGSNVSVTYEGPSDGYWYPGLKKEWSVYSAFSSVVCIGQSNLAGVAYNNSRDRYEQYGCHIGWPSCHKGGKPSNSGYIVAFNKTREECDELHGEFVWPKDSRPELYPWNPISEKEYNPDGSAANKLLPVEPLGYFDYYTITRYALEKQTYIGWSSIHYPHVTYPDGGTSRTYGSLMPIGLGSNRYIYPYDERAAHSALLESRLRMPYSFSNQPLMDKQYDTDCSSLTAGTPKLIQTVTPIYADRMLGDFSNSGPIGDLENRQNPPQGWAGPFFTYSLESYPSATREFYGYEINEWRDPNGRYYDPRGACCDPPTYENTCGGDSPSFPGIPGLCNTQSKYLGRQNGYYPRGLANASATGFVEPKGERYGVLATINPDSGYTQGWSEGNFNAYDFLVLTTHDTNPLKAYFAPTPQGGHLWRNQEIDFMGVAPKKSIYWFSRGGGSIGSYVPENPNPADGVSYGYGQDDPNGGGFMGKRYVYTPYVEHVRSGPGEVRLLQHHELSPTIEPTSSPPIPENSRIIISTTIFATSENVVERLKEVGSGFYEQFSGFADCTGFCRNEHIVGYHEGYERVKFYYHTYRALHGEENRVENIFVAEDEIKHALNFAPISSNPHIVIFDKEVIRRQMLSGCLGPQKSWSQNPYKHVYGTNTYNPTQRQAAYKVKRRYGGENAYTDDISTSLKIFLKSNTNTEFFGTFMINKLTLHDDTFNTSVAKPINYFEEDNEDITPGDFIDSGSFYTSAYPNRGSTSIGPYYKAANAYYGRDFSYDPNRYYQNTSSNTARKLFRMQYSARLFRSCNLHPCCTVFVNIRERAMTGDSGIIVNTPLLGPPEDYVDSLYGFYVIWKKEPFLQQKYTGAVATDPTIWGHPCAECQAPPAGALFAQNTGVRFVNNSGSGVCYGAGAISGDLWECGYGGLFDRPHGYGPTEVYVSFKTRRVRETTVHTDNEWMSIVRGQRLHNQICFPEGFNWDGPCYTNSGFVAALNTTSDYVMVQYGGADSNTPLYGYGKPYWKIAEGSNPVYCGMDFPPLNCEPYTIETGNTTTIVGTTLGDTTFGGSKQFYYGKRPKTCGTISYGGGIAECGSMDFGEHDNFSQECKNIKSNPVYCWEESCGEICADQIEGWDGISYPSVGVYPHLDIYSSVPNARYCMLEDAEYLHEFHERIVGSTFYIGTSPDHQPGMSLYNDSRQYCASSLALSDANADNLYPDVYVRRETKPSLPTGTITWDFSNFQEHINLNGDPVFILNETGTFDSGAYKDEEVLKITEEHLNPLVNRYEIPPYPSFLAMFNFDNGLQNLSFKPQIRLMVDSKDEGYSFPFGYVNIYATYVTHGTQSSIGLLGSTRDVLGEEIYNLARPLYVGRGPCEGNGTWQTNPPTVMCDGYTSIDFENTFAKIRFPQTNGLDTGTKNAFGLGPGWEHFRLHAMYDALAKVHTPPNPEKQPLYLNITYQRMRCRDFSLEKLADFICGMANPNIGESYSRRDKFGWHADDSNNTITLLLKDPLRHIDTSATTSTSFGRYVHEDDAFAGAINLDNYIQSRQRRLSGESEVATSPLHLHRLPITTCRGSSSTGHLVANYPNPRSIAYYVKYDADLDPLNWTTRKIFPSIIPSESIPPNNVGFVPPAYDPFDPNPVFITLDDYYRDTVCQRSYNA